MSDRYATILLFSRLFVRISRALNLVLGVLIVAMLLASFPFEPVFREFFSKQPPRIGAWMLIPTLRAWMLLALPMIGATHILLSRLLAMVDTVRAGDPFVPENAVRMNTIAWCMLAIQLLGLAFGAMAGIMNAAGSNIDWEFSATGWLAVLLLFVLARVFEEGTRIRTDLEAMI